MEENKTIEEGPRNVHVELKEGLAGVNARSEVNKSIRTSPCGSLIEDLKLHHLHTACTSPCRSLIRLQ